MMERNGHDEDWPRLLRDNTSRAPVDDVDWHSLHAAVTARGAPLLHRRAVTWWQVLGAPTAGVRTLAAAAVLALVLGAGVLLPDRPVAMVTDTGFRTIEETLTGAQTSALLEDDRDEALAALLLTEGSL